MINMENVHVVYIIRYIYKLCIIIILKYTMISVKYVKFDLYDENKWGPIV